MIRINMLDVSKQKLNAAVAKALETIRNRTFSGRNPQLGKMFNCPICDRRHRGTICEPKYAVGRYADPKVPLIASQETAKGVLGAHVFAKKRFHPHPNRKGLLLVQRTQFLYPLFEKYINDPVECMKGARTEAARQLKDEARIQRRLKRLLLKGTALTRWYWGTKPSTTIKNKRQEKQALRTKVNAEVENGF